ncbi:IS630 family transposase [Bacillus sp. CGMCC 1.16541]|uniref:IS630 family transposase n=1 Tax=Bacillus sp. CGMCC 1.16541 TaxID=2185143 RepID=UPI0019521AF5|nr:IS630 family transposase [Bacillus sp. CGMCC 1.16541]
MQVASTERCNAQSFESFLNQLLEHYPNQHLFIVLDNARYHHARYLHPFLEKRRDHLTLWFLPPYSPELNLIERFWKWLKGTVVANCYYSERSALLSAVQQFLDNVNQTPQKVLKRIGFSC